MVGGIVRTSVSLPKDLIRALETFIKITKTYRSKITQQAIRNFLSIPHGEEDLVAGSLMIVYTHEEHGLEEEITDIQHEFISLIISNLHIHLDKKRCMLTIFVRGEFKEVQRMIDRIVGRRGVLMVKDSLVKI